jgi:hypothetical protein
MTEFHPCRSRKDRRRTRLADRARVLDGETRCQAGIEGFKETRRRGGRDGDRGNSRKAAMRWWRKRLTCCIICWSCCTEWRVRSWTMSWQSLQGRTAQSGCRRRRPARRSNQGVFMDQTTIVAPSAPRSFDQAPERVFALPVFTAAKWAEFRADTPLTLTEDEVRRLRSLDDPVDLDEVRRIYLSCRGCFRRMWNRRRAVRAAQAFPQCLNVAKTPFIIGSPARWPSASRPPRVLPSC